MINKPSALGLGLLCAALAANTAQAGARYFYGTVGCSGGGGSGYWVQQGGGAFYDWKVNDDGVCSGQTQWATGDDAIFGGAAGNVTVRTSGNHTCNRIEVRTGGYRFAATGGNLASVVINTGRFTVTSGATTLVTCFGGSTNTLRFSVAGGNPFLADGTGTLDFEGATATVIDAAKIHVTGGGRLICVGPASTPRTPAVFLADGYKLDANSTLYFKNYGPTFSANLGLTLGNNSGGQIQVDGGYTATFGGPLSGATTLTKLGAGKLMLSGDNAGFSGVIEIDGGTLGGVGMIGGAVALRSGGTLEPGISIGSLTLTAAPGLEGTLLMEIDTSRSPAADKLVVSGAPLVCGGTLIISNIGPALAGGEVFDLFDATGFTGVFSTMILPPLDANVNWWTGNLTNAGTLAVNRPPTAQDKTYTRGRGASLKITKSDLLVGATDPDAGDSPGAASLAGTGTQGAAVSETDAFIFYSPANDNSDTLQFRVTDHQGGATTNNLCINVGGADGQGQEVSVNGGIACVSFAGIPGYSYVIQRSTNLADWASLVTTNAPATGLFRWVDSFPDLGAPPGSAYYRLLRP